jgi:pilus assembly protein CpaC
LIFSPAPEIRVTGSDLVLKKYETFLRPFGITILKDESSLDISPTVKVQITVAEVRRDKDGNFVVYSVKKQRADKIQVK